VDQAVELVVRDLGIVQDVVALFVVPDGFAELLDALVRGNHRPKEDLCGLCTLCVLRVFC
jgi:hypothetical protein